MLSQRETRKLVNDIKEQAIKDWFLYGDFNQWFWDRADDYELDEEDIKNMNNIIQKLIDKMSTL